MLHRRTFDAGKASESTKTFSYSGHRASHIKESGFAPDGRAAPSHHALPHEFRVFFKGAGIDHNNPIFKTWLATADHVALHGKQGQYNQSWDAFFAKNASPSPEQIFAKLVSLANEHGFDIGNYVMRADGSRLIWTEVPLRGGAGGGGLLEGLRPMSPAHALAANSDHVTGMSPDAKKAPNVFTLSA